MSNANDYTITSLSQSIVQRNFSGEAKVAPFTLGVRGLNSLRGTCVPYYVTDGGPPPPGDRDDCGIPDGVIKLPLIDSTSELYLPSVIDTTTNLEMPLIGATSGLYDPSVLGLDNYTEIIDAKVTSTISTQVGSIYLNSDTLNKITILASDDGGHFDYWSTKIRRFTDNSLLVDFKITCATTSSVTETNISVPANDWYDIYLSASTTPGTASLEGIYIQYKL